MSDTDTKTDYSTFYNAFDGLPMPGDQFLDKGIVIASCMDIIDEQEYDSATLLILRKEAPYYLVCHTVRTDYDSPWQYRGGDQHPNIIPATESYSDLIGGY